MTFNIRGDSSTALLCAALAELRRNGFTGGMKIVKQMDHTGFAFMAGRPVIPPSFVRHARERFPKLFREGT